MPRFRFTPRVSWPAGRSGPHRLRGVEVRGLGAVRALNIVATTAMIGDVVRQVAGERASVTVLMGEGRPPPYRQTRSDVVAMTRAGAVFWHGLNLEAQLAEFLADLGHRPSWRWGERVARDKLIDDPAAPGKPDPHIWMDPRLWRDVVVAGLDELARLEPAGRSAFAANAVISRRSTGWRSTPSARSRRCLRTRVSW